MGIRSWAISETMSILGSNVLVLNKSYLPVNVTTVKRAFVLLYEGIARALDEQYQTFDFNSWSELAVALDRQHIGLVNRAIRVPRVILLVSYDRVPKRHVRFNRYNIYARDKNTCQYCGKKGTKRDLNIDHVIPRSRGGKSVWANVVCSCLRCNRVKGGRTPKEARMKLRALPKRPSWTPFLPIGEAIRYKEWKPFLNFVDASYWEAELVD